MVDPAVLINRLDRVKGTITRANQFCDSINSNTSLELISARLEALDEAWTEFKAIEDELTHIPEQNPQIEEYENRYLEAKSIFMREIKIRTPSTSDQLNVHYSTMLPNTTLLNAPFTKDIRLPRLNIPIFSGDFKEWITFQDLFYASVHTNDLLSASQKFQYLMGLLRGEAATTVRHLKISDANYEIALAKLEKKYSRRGHIVKSLVKTFLTQPLATQLSAKHLRCLADIFDEVIRGLKAIGEQAETRDVWLIQIALSKVDPDTRQEWARETRDKDFPLIQEFIDFLYNRWEELDSSNLTPKKNTNVVSRHHSAPIPNCCPLCSQNHNLMACSSFKNLIVQDRRNLVSINSICFNCLRSGHSVRKCNSRYRCQKCKRNHHTLLHETIQQQLPIKEEQLRTTALEKQQQGIRTQTVPEDNLDTLPCFSSLDSQKLNHNAEISALVIRTAFSETYSNHFALLPTAKVHVLDLCGHTNSLRVLLDSGSQASLITESCVQRLRLRREHSRITINGLGSVGAGVTRGKVSLTLLANFDHSQKIQINALIMTSLTKRLPAVEFNTASWNHIGNLILADPQFYKPGVIDIIIGAEYFFKILCDGQIKGNEGFPEAQKTIFGWIIAGDLPSEKNSPSVKIIHSSIDLDHSIRRFWELEDTFASVQSPSLTKEQSDCEQHFQTTYYRTSTGRYVVRLPFKRQPNDLGNSKSIAFHRLKSMERRFTNNAILKTEYIKFMQECISLGHMELTTDSNSQHESQFYLPHYAIFKDFPKKKIRIVFDGSAKTSSNISINSCLMVGPTIQRDLVSVLLSFRKHKVAFYSEIEKMYRQVQLDPSDQDWHRILWRENSQDEVEHFKLTTVTYGTACAPFLATRTLQQVAKDHRTKFPEASAIIENNVYEDELLSGANTIEEAISIERDISTILSSCGFRLHMWKSNSYEFLADGLSQVTNDITPLPIDSDSNYEKVLSLQWIPSRDTFSFLIQPFSDSVLTKRQILSESSRIFDPLGWLSPTTIQSKILFQRLWLQSYKWDDPLPSLITRRWVQIRAQLGLFEQLNIPRWLHFTNSGMNLHGFSGASENAYAAVIYSVILDEHGQQQVTLVTAKTRVAPLKQISLPRLQLCGALLLVRLMNKVMEALGNHTVEFHGWTDSEIVLVWLSDIPRRWNMFVANRTSEILDSIPKNRWRYILSNLNPADCASRGLCPAELIEYDLWWKGPSVLTSDISSYKKSSVSKIAQQYAREEERKKFCQVFHTQQSDDILHQLVERYSSWTTLIRVLSLCLRFAFNARNNKGNRRFGFLTTQELDDATYIICRCVQQISFEPEYKRLLKKYSLPPKSTILSLSPFLDDKGVIRVGGRIQNAACNLDKEHQIILPKKHTVTTLIIFEMHMRYLHPATSHLISIIRQRYWIVGGRNAVKQHVHKCISCFRKKCKDTTQLIGNLPECRLMIGRPFLRTGIDYAGPFLFHTRRGRGAKAVKGCIAIFVCMATKAVHIELVSDLSTEAFITAMRRFISKRGAPSDIYSDNGTNFVGASRRLTELHNLLLSQKHNSKISKFLSQGSTNWHFIPPAAAPHFGGMWESAVKLVKIHLVRVLGNNIPTFDEMTTLLAQVEAVLNSRPLCAISSDPEDIEALTPGHFLVGTAFTALPEPNFTEKDPSRLQRWQLIQAMVHGLWKRWRSDYLTTLQQRPKWQRVPNSLTIGDLVIIAEENTPPCRWLLGRISETHPGEDGLVRVATVRTRDGFLKKPVVKLQRLPIT